MADALITLSGCDKTVPAALMPIPRGNHIGITLYAGTVRGCQVTWCCIQSRTSESDLVLHTTKSASHSTLARCVADDSYPVTWCCIQSRTSESDLVLHTTIVGNHTLRRHGAWA
jgi:dihydroxyacid dehydratase/phosphogluconate dehydratase